MADNQGVINVIPAEAPQQPLYANAAFSFFGPNREITIAFLRIPPMLDEQLKEVQDSRVIKAPTVVAVTLPAEIAIGLAQSVLATLLPLEGKK